MYKQGDAKLFRRYVTEEEWDIPTDDGHLPFQVYDARNKHASPPFVYLPHSCQEWVIGGPAEVRQLIKDLLALLVDMESI